MVSTHLFSSLTSFVDDGNELTQPEPIKLNSLLKQTNLQCEISDKSLSLLDPPLNPGQEESWLNDEVINGYIELVEKYYQKEQATTEKI